MNIERKLKSIVASMELDGFKLEQEDIDRCRRILAGESTADEEIEAILEKYKE